MTSLTRIAISAFFGVFLTASAGVGAQTKEGMFNVGEEPVVKGLPYSGEAITTVKLTMFDGTKMERTVTAKLFRDSAGRLRREQTVVGLEALDPNNDFRAVVHLLDPVAGVFYTLNPGERTALRLPLSMLQGGPKPLSVPFQYEKKEVDLGVKDIDGLSAQGRRIVTTVPTDPTGNSKPIEIIDERWESVELKVLLRSLHRDPRSGDVEYVLTKISRTEPQTSMFTVPSGYTIRDLVNQSEQQTIGAVANERHRGKSEQPLERDILRPEAAVSPERDSLQDAPANSLETAVHEAARNQFQHVGSPPFKLRRGRSEGSH